MLTTGAEAADREQGEGRQSSEKLLKGPAQALIKDRNSGERERRRDVTLTLHGSAGISHVDQRDWDDESLAR